VEFFFEDHLEDFVDFDDGAKIHLNMCIIHVWQLQINLILHFIFSLCCFLGFFCAMWSSL